MKYLISFLLVLALPVIACAAVDQDPQEFKVTYTVVYNSIALSEASKIEQEIKMNHEGACSVKTSVDENVAETATSGDYFIFTTDNT